MTAREMREINMNIQKYERLFFSRPYVLTSVFLSIGVICYQLIYTQPETFEVIAYTVFTFYIFISICLLFVPIIKFDGNSMAVSPRGFLPYKIIELRHIKGYKKRNSWSLILRYKTTYGSEKLVYTGMLAKSDLNRLMLFLTSKYIQEDGA